MPNTPSATPATPCRSPRAWTSSQAAALPETVFTVFANVFEHGALKAGETLLVHGATSGIGVTAIQMAKAAGAKVIATARGADKAATAQGAGRRRRGRRHGRGLRRGRQGARAACDVVLDMVGGDYFAKDLDALKTGGRIVFIASLGGGEVELPIGRLMQKRAVVTGSTLRPRNADEKARLAARGRARGLAVDRGRQGRSRRSTRPSRWPRPPRPTPTWRAAPTSARSC